MERDMDVEARSGEKRRLRTSSSSFKTVTREIVMKYLEEEQRKLEEYNTTTEEEIDSCKSFSETETDTDVEEMNKERCIRTSSSLQNVTKEIVMKYLEEEEEHRKLEDHNMTTDEEMDSYESFSETETDTDVEERSKKRRLRTSSSFQIVTKEIVMKYLEEEEEQRKMEAHKMITEKEMDSCEHDHHSRSEVSAPLSEQRKLHPVKVSFRRII
ncbi:eukaryotic translation initiation factor 3 subunit C-like [Colossoma macropomum]|uniref:eukaryotic translation initiation factor 3 subunit C-like n=1 Tax=Colossoma macropomum TaxID=42526 RepID=UPI001864CD15|nr:eukaryotic translation initiation factor 3 subunit C-like [Colossoma macropomum]